MRINKSFNATSFLKGTGDVLSSLQKTGTVLVVALEEQGAGAESELKCNLIRLTA